MFRHTCVYLFTLFLMGVVFPCAAATQYEGLPDEQPLFYGVYVGQNKVGYLESGGYLLDHENGSTYFVAYNEPINGRVYKTWGACHSRH